MLSAQASRAGQPLASHAAWTVSGSAVTLRLTFPRTAAALLARPGQPVPATEAVGRYVLNTTKVTQDLRPCPAVDLGYDLGDVEPLFVGPALFGFEMQFRCPGTGGVLSLRTDALFDTTAEHVSLATVRVEDARAVSRLVTAGDRTLRVANGKLLDGRSPGTCAGLGLHHLLTSTVPLFSLAGLATCVRQRRELLWLALGCAGGYLAAALLAGLGHFDLAAGPVQAWNGLLVLLTAALVMGRGAGDLGRPSLGLAIVAGIAALVAAARGLTDVALALLGAGLSGFCLLHLWRTAADHPARWLAPGLLLSLVDGFWVPDILEPVLPLAQLQGADILAFNVGAAGTALAVLAAVAGGRWLLARRASFRAHPVVGDLVAASLAGLGAFLVLAV
jgi:hypothetical protein